MDEDLTAGISQLTPGQRPEGQDSDLRYGKKVYDDTRRYISLRCKIPCTRRKVMDKLQENKNFLPFSKVFLISTCLGKLQQIFVTVWKSANAVILSLEYKHRFSYVGLFFDKGKFEAK